MSEQDALIELDLDMSKVETKLAQLDKTFAAFSKQKSWFSGLNQSLVVLTENLQATERAFSGFATSVTKATGLSLNDAKAQVEAAKAQEVVSRAVLASARAQENMAKADAARAKASVATARALRDEAAAEETLNRAIRTREATSTRSTGTQSGPVQGPDLNRRMRTAYIAQELRNGRDISATQVQNEKYRRDEAIATVNQIKAAYGDLDGTIKQVGVSIQNDVRYAQELRDTAKENMDAVYRAGGVERFSKNNNQPIAATQQMVKAAEELGVPLRASLGVWDRIFAKSQTHLLQLPIMLLEYQAINAVMQGMSESWNEMVKSTSEFQIQGVLFDANKQSRLNSGLSSGGNSNQLMNESIRLASAYGDKVNDVAQDLNLWYKQTGDLSAASYMTGQALKFQVATGTDLEDTYRTLTALGSQLSGIKFGGGIKGTFDLSRTHEFLEIITAAAVSAGAGLHQVSENEKELRGAKGNSAGILSEALEKDAASLKDMGLNLVQIVALNQALIQSFGNTGHSAEEVAEKLSRITGAFAGLSNPKTNESLKKIGIDLSELTTAQSDTQKLTVFEQFAKVYDGLEEKYKGNSKALQEYLNHLIGGQRQYQVVIDLVENLSKAKKIEQDITKNMGLEDQIAASMQDTYEQSSKRLQSTLEGVGMELGVRILPMLTQVTNDMATAIPVIGMLADKFMTLAGAIAGAGVAFATSKLLGRIGAGAAGGPVGLIITGLAAATGNVIDQHNAGALRYGSDFNRFAGYRADYKAGQIESIPDSVLKDKAFRAFLAHADTVDKQNSAYFGDKSSTSTPVDDKGNPVSDIKKARYINHRAYLAATKGYSTADIEAGITADEQSNPTVSQAILSGDASKKSAAILKQINDASAANAGKITGSASGAGALKDYQIASEGLHELVDAYQSASNASKDYVAKMDDEVDAANRNIKMNGLSEAAIKQLAKATKDKNAAIQSEINQEQKSQGAFRTAETAAVAHARALGLNTQEGKGWMTVAREADREYYSLANSIRSLTKEQRNNTDAVAENQARLAQQNYSLALKHGNSVLNADERAINEAKGIGNKMSDEAKFHNDANGIHKALADEIARTLKGEDRKRAEDALRDWWDNLVQKDGQFVTNAKEEMRKQASELTRSIAGETAKLWETAVPMANFKAPQAQYIKSMIDLKKQSDDLEQQYRDKKQALSGPLTGDPTRDNQLIADRQLVEDWHNIGTAVISAEKAAADFNKRVEEVQASALYKGVEAAFSEISKDISQATVNLLTFSHAEDNHIRQYQQEIDLINEKKFAEDLSYSSMKFHTATQTAIHEIQMHHYDQEIQKLHDMQKAQENARNRPNVIKKVAEAFSKSVIDTLLQQMTQGAMKKLFHLDDGSKQLQNALNKHVNVITSTLAPSLSKFDTSADRLAGSLDRFSAKGGGSSGGSGGGPLGLLGNIFDSSAQSGTAWASDAAGDGTGGYGNPAASSLGDTLIKANNNSGIGAWLKTNGQNMTDGMAFLATAYQGYQQGGTGGALQAGMGMFEGLSSLSQIGGLGFLGPAAIPAAIVAAGFTLFQNKATPQKNPDQFYTSELGQGLADVAGAGMGGVPTYNANGQSFSVNSQLYSTLGNQGEESYIANFIKQHPDIAAQVLTPQEMALFTNASGIAYGTNGDVSLNNGQHEQWNQLIQDSQDATSAIQKYQDALNQGMQQTLVAVNMYGATVGAFPMIWNQPGYNWPTAPSANAPGYGGTNPYTNVTPTSGSGGGGGNTTVIVNTSVDGKPLARNYQAYMLRSQAAGYSRIS